ncbi:MAG: hypothetical protein KGK10_03045, partial [Rhodospirillales bacterium]|nr:hypothetical protein [Rhodospirillales bacterium]
PAAAAAPGALPRPAPRKPEVLAHVQARGDVTVPLGAWMGEKGSGRWIEGFAIAPEGVAAADIEYQAVLGKGWLSPWVEGAQFCGSRGMALPVLGLRVRLRNEISKTRSLRLEASFVDGSSAGPVGDGEVCESASLAPLEAFRIEMIPREESAEGGRASRLTRRRA